MTKQNELKGSFSFGGDAITFHPPVQKGQCVGKVKEESVNTAPSTVYWIDSKCNYRNDLDPYANVPAGGPGSIKSYHKKQEDLQSVNLASKSPVRMPRQPKIDTGILNDNKSEEKRHKDHNYSDLFDSTLREAEKGPKGNIKIHNNLDWKETELYESKKKYPL